MLREKNDTLDLKEQDGSFHWFRFPLGLKKSFCTSTVTSWCSEQRGYSYYFLLFESLPHLAILAEIKASFEIAPAVTRRS